MKGTVFIQNQRGPHPTNWDAPGVHGCTDTAGPAYVGIKININIVMDVGQHDQYVVKVDGSGRLTTRNRRFLRKYTPATLDISYQAPMSLPPVCVVLQPTQQPFVERRSSVPSPGQPQEDPIVPITSPRIPPSPLQSKTSDASILHTQQELYEPRRSVSLFWLCFLKM